MAGIDKLLADSEALTRQELAALPRGMFEAEDYIDDDGIGNGPFRVCVKVTIEPDKIVCDFTGTHPRLRRGDIARLITATGGGYGDPLKRPVERVVDDVRNGFVTRETARRSWCRRWPQSE